MMKRAMAGLLAQLPSVRGNATGSTEIVESSDPNADGKDHRRPSGISPQTLIIASVASAAASFAVAGSGARER